MSTYILYHIVTCKYLPFELLLLCILVVSLQILGASAFTFSYLPSIAEPNTTWLNEGDYSTGSSSNPILFSDPGGSRPIFLAGFFFCNVVKLCYYTETRGSFLAVVIASRDGSAPRVIWTNREFPLYGGARLEFTSEGNLEWANLSGDVAWSSNTKGKSVRGLKLTESGNLVMFDVNGSIIWQSFDHPTDTLVPGQRLLPGRKITSSGFEYGDWNENLYYSLLVNQEGMFAFVSQPRTSETYFQYSFNHTEKRYIEFRNGSFGNSNSDIFLGIPKAVSTQYMQLGQDGHLKVYEHQSHISFGGLVWKEVADVIPIGKCDYPLACGNYGVCKDNNNCSAPISKDHSTDIFKFIDLKKQGHPEEGFSPNNPLDCDASDVQAFVELEDAGYFSSRSDINGTNLTHCKQECLKQCSCRLVVFSEDTGNCLLSVDVFSLKGLNTSQGQNKVFTFIKVQPYVASRRKKDHQRIVGITVGGFLSLVVIIGSICLIVKRKQRFKMKKRDKQVEEDGLNLVGGMLCRFSLDELNVATSNFSKKLGHGGFGSVFEGVLKDGNKIAVKRLHSIEQVKSSFLAEVESIGKIHHINLVRLIGFCTDKVDNYLVYEYMTNGSLEKWIYNKNPRSVLDWNVRKDIIKDVAKGLAYLHEECRQKIVHLDVKPQNILLDEKFNAKISDFGLAKLIEWNQSKVVTTVRGTPGYLAPEWLRGVITEKADVYSFGVVLLEMVCGRKHFEESEPEQCQHLISLVKIKAAQGQLSDLVDKHCEDMGSHVDEVIRTMKISIWCLQPDRTKRPSMSTVVKVLEGVMNVEDNLDDDLPVEVEYRYRPTDATPLLDSILTGPR